MSAGAMPTRQMLAYGALGFPLAFAALPLLRACSQAVCRQRRPAAGAGRRRAAADALRRCADRPAAGTVERSPRQPAAADPAFALPLLGLGLAALLAPPADGEVGGHDVAGTDPGADLHRLQPCHHQLSRLGRRDRRNPAGARTASPPRARCSRWAAWWWLPRCRRCWRSDAATALRHLGWLFVPILALAALATFTGAPPANATAGARCAARPAALRRVRRPALSPPAHRARHRRHRLGDPGDAGAVLHRRRAAAAGMAGAVPRHLLRLWRSRPAGLGCTGAAPRQGTRLVGEHGAGDRQLRLGIPARRRRRYRLRPDLRRQRCRARRRTGAAAGAAGRSAGRRSPRRTARQRGQARTSASGISSPSSISRWPPASPCRWSPCSATKSAAATRRIRGCSPWPPPTPCCRPRSRWFHCWLLWRWKPHFEGTHDHEAKHCSVSASPCSRRPSCSAVAPASMSNSTAAETPPLDYA
jgi:hypothetical protein